MKKVSISDIADELDISRNTVSKVMNNRGKVSDKTRKQIVDMAIKMGYEKLPKELLPLSEDENKPKSILVIATAPDFSSFWGKIIKGISKQLVEDNYKCLYNFITFEEADNFQFPDIIDKEDISGLIVVNVYNNETIKVIKNSGIPTVYFDISLNYNAEDVKADIVLMEGRRSIYKITKDLISNGNKTIGFFGDTSYCKSIMERWQGFIAAHEEAKLPINYQYCFTYGKRGHFYFENEIEYAIAGALKKRTILPDAIVCANDFIAYKLIRELKKYGYSVPKDIRVSGFDDMKSFENIEGIEEASEFLTTVSIDLEEIGVRLANQIDMRIKKPQRYFEEVKICGVVKLRQSTGN